MGRMKDPMKIHHMRLINGDEIIACVHKVTADEIHITHPLKVEKVDTEEGKATLFVRYMNYTKDKEVSLNKTHVVASGEVHEEMMKYYFLSLKSESKSLDTSLSALKDANKHLEDLLSGGSCDMGNEVDLAQMAVLSRSVH